MLNTDARILVVDDSKLVRLAMKRIFSILGYENVIEAMDGREAIDQHAKERPGLIVLDIVMPNMRGDEALAKIRDIDTATPIIMLSSVAKQSEIDRCRSLGITEFLVKPIVAPDVLATLKAQLQLIA
jgi:CheY-like chemotaxis protein